MPQRTLVLLTVVLVVSACSHAAAQSRLTPQYAAGWNLVSGPAGSTLQAATGPLYTLPPGASAYASLPADAPLQAGVGYWAYFPAGGGLLPGAGGDCMLSIAGSRTWFLIGNPSATAPALVGDRTAPLGLTGFLVYDPETASYRAALQSIIGNSSTGVVEVRSGRLAPGQAAWVRVASDGDDLVISAC